MLEERVCEICGKKFVPLIENQRCCSYNCQRHIENYCYKEDINATICPICGKEIEDVNYKYCSEECKKVFNKMMYESWKKKEPRRCDYCGKEFVPKSSTTRYCCVDCRTKGNDERHIKIAKVWALKSEKDDKIVKIIEKTEDTEDMKPREFQRIKSCKVCGTIFYSPGSRDCCSEECSDVLEVIENIEEKLEDAKKSYRKQLNLYTNYDIDKNSTNKILRRNKDIEKGEAHIEKLVELLRKDLYNRYKSETFFYEDRKKAREKGKERWETLIREGFLPESEKEERNRICEVCGKSFTPIIENQRCCSYECQKQIKKEINEETGKAICPICGKESNRIYEGYCSEECEEVFRQMLSKSCTEKKAIEPQVEEVAKAEETPVEAPEVKVCPVCGKEFTPGKHYQIYCSEECKKRENYRRHSLSGFIKGDTKVCPVCGKEFIASTGDQKYCSEDCRRIRGNKKNSLSGFTKGDTKICPVCGKKFTLTLGTQIYCSRECSSKFQSKKRNKSGAVKGDTKICPVCGKEFIASTGSQKYCSKECSNKFWSRRISKLGVFKGDTKVCPVCGKEFTINNGNQVYCSRECSVKSWNKIKNVSGFAKGDTRVCPVCGKEFIANAGNQKYCSKECSNKFWHEKVKRELLEKDTGKAQDNLGAETSIKEVLAPQESTWITCAPQEITKEEVIIEKRKCAYCGKEFIPETEDQEYCSLECRVKKFTEYERTHRHYTLPSGIKQIPLIYKYENGLVEGKEFEERTCIVCGKKFKPLFENQRWCSWECKKEIPDVPFKPGEKRECLFCGKEFTMTKHNQKYCSVECSSASHDLVAMYYNDLWLEKGVTENDRLCSKCGEKFTPKTPRQFCCSKCEGLKEEIITPVLEPKKVREQKECAFCGKEFTPKVDYQKYCSKECSSKMYKIIARERQKIKEEYEAKKEVVNRANKKRIRVLDKIKNFFIKPKEIKSNTKLKVEHKGIVVKKEPKEERIITLHAYD